MKDKDTSTLHTDGVNTLLGDPGKAIIKLSVPVIVSMFTLAIYNLTDSIWVSGLGPDALSAVGFFFPLFVFITAIATGIGIGGGTCIAQHLGAEDKQGAERIAVHMFFILVITSLLIILPLFFLARPLFVFMGAGKAIDPTVSYARILTIALLFMFVLHGVDATFRSEGNAKRAMSVFLIGLILNMILDPVFIYPLGLGVAGAAWASLVSVVIVTLVGYHWIFVKKIPYVAIRIRGFKPDKKSMKQILGLGIPVSLSQVFMAVMFFINTMIAAYVGKTDGVAVYNSGLRFTNLTILPIVGITSSFITVVGAAFGAKNKDKMQAAFTYTLKLSMGVASGLMVLTILTAPLITKMFTWSEETRVLTGDFITFFRVFVLLLPALAVTLTVTSLFMGMSRGGTSLMLIICRTVIFTIPCTLTLGVVFKFGLVGIWWGIVIGNWLTACLAFLWAGKFLDAEGVIDDKGWNYFYAFNFFKNRKIKPAE